MGRGRARTAAGCLLGALALALSAAGCGAESHPNEQRPEPPTRLGITITPKAVVVEPTHVAFGPEADQQIPQNQRQAQPPIKKAGAPLIVVLVTANQTTHDAKLVLRGPANASSGTILAHAPGSFQTSLPTGSYTIAARGVPGARAARLDVGPYRASSQNDVLLP